jgi:hypothetical protein
MRRHRLVPNLRTRHGVHGDQIGIHRCENLRQAVLILGARILHDFPIHLIDDFPYLIEKLLTFCSEMNRIDPPIVRIPVSPDETASLESIDQVSECDLAEIEYLGKFSLCDSRQMKPGDPGQHGPLRARYIQGLDARTESRASQPRYTVSQKSDPNIFAFFLQGRPSAMMLSMRYSSVQYHGIDVFRHQHRTAIVQSSHSIFSFLAQVAQSKTQHVPRSN